MDKHVLVATLMMLAATVAANAANLTVTIAEDDPCQITMAYPKTVTFHIRGALDSDTSNEGLAGVFFDLKMEYGGQEVDINDAAYSVSVVAGPNMTPFDRNVGITNPSGFGGTVSGNYLVQIGGRQDTLGHAGRFADFPTGPVTLDLATPTSGTMTLATVTVTLPTEPTTGDYILTVENCHAVVISQGDRTGPVYDIEKPTTDLQAASIDYGPQCRCDVTCSGAVDDMDKSFVTAHMGCSVGTGDADCDRCDVNENGYVSTTDIGMVKNNYGICP